MGRSVKTKQDQHPNPTIHNRSEIESGTGNSQNQDLIQLWFYLYSYIKNTTYFWKKAAI